MTNVIAATKKSLTRAVHPGGYTCLAALTDSKVFSAGISLYGISDVKLLAGDTHKVCISTAVATSILNSRAALHSAMFSSR